MKFKCVDRPTNTYFVNPKYELKPRTKLLDITNEVLASKGSPIGDLVIVVDVNIFDWKYWI